MNALFEKELDLFLSSAEISQKITGTSIPEFWFCPSHHTHSSFLEFYETLLYTYVVNQQMHTDNICFTYLTFM
jgi:hypothetical protein